MSQAGGPIGALVLLFLGGGIVVAPSLPASSAAPAEQTPDIATLVQRIDEQRLHDHIAAIDEPRNAFEQPGQLQATADYGGGLGNAPAIPPKGR